MSVKINNTLHSAVFRFGTPFSQLVKYCQLIIHFTEIQCCFVKKHTKIPSLIRGQQPVFPCWLESRGNPLSMISMETQDAALLAGSSF